MKKKIFSLTLGFAALALLASCGGSSKNKSKEEDSKSQTVEVSSNGELSNESQSYESQSDETISSEIISSTDDVVLNAKYDILLSTSYLRINVINGKIVSMYKFGNGLKTYMPSYNSDGEIDFIKCFDFESSFFYKEIELGVIGDDVRFFYDKNGNFNIVETNTNYQYNGYGSEVYNGGYLNNIIIDNKGNITKNLSSDQKLNKDNINYNITDTKIEVTKEQGDLTYKYTYEINDDFTGRYSLTCGKDLLRSISISLTDDNKLLIERVSGLSAVKKAKVNDTETLLVSLDGFNVSRVEYTNIYDVKSTYTFQYNKNNRKTSLTTESEYESDNYTDTYTYNDDNKLLVSIEEGIYKTTYYYDSYGNRVKEVYGDDSLEYLEVLEYDKYLNPLVEVEIEDHGKFERHYEYDEKYRRINVSTYLYENLTSTNKRVYSESGYAFDDNDNIITSFSYSYTPEGKYYDYSSRSEYVYENGLIVKSSTYGPNSTFDKLEIKNEVEYEHDENGYLQTNTSYSDGNKSKILVTYLNKDTGIVEKRSESIFEYTEDEDHNYVKESYYEYEKSGNKTLTTETLKTYLGDKLEQTEIKNYDYQYKCIKTYIDVIDKDEKVTKYEETFIYNDVECTEENIKSYNKSIVVGGKTWSIYSHGYAENRYELYTYKIQDDRVVGYDRVINIYDDNGLLTFHRIYYYEKGENGEFLGERVIEFELNEDGSIKSSASCKYKEAYNNGLYYKEIISYVYNSNGDISSTSTQTMTISDDGTKSSSIYTGNYVYSKEGDLDVVTITNARMVGTNFVNQDKYVYKYLDGNLIEEEKYVCQTTGVLSDTPSQHYEYTYVDGKKVSATCKVLGKNGNITYTYDGDKLVKEERIYDDGEFLTFEYDDLGYNQISSHEEDYGDQTRTVTVNGRYDYFLGDDKQMSQIICYDSYNYKQINDEKVFVSNTINTQEYKTKDPYLGGLYLASVTKDTDRQAYVDENGVTQNAYTRHSVVTYDETDFTTSAYVVYSYSVPVEGVSYSQETVSFDKEYSDTTYLETSDLLEYDENGQPVRETITRYEREFGSNNIVVGRKIVYDGTDFTEYTYDTSSEDWVELASK